MDASIFTVECIGGFVFLRAYSDKSIMEEENPERITGG